MHWPGSLMNDYDGMSFEELQRQVMSESLVSEPDTNNHSIDISPYTSCVKIVKNYSETLSAIPVFGRLKQLFAI